MNVLNYQNWNKRKILVLKMLTETDRLENRLQTMGIPHLVYDCEKEEHIHRDWEKIKDTVCGIIISGSRTTPDWSYYPAFPEDIMNVNVPFLGICYGHEYLGELLGAQIIDAPGGGEHMGTMARLSKDPLFESLEIDREMPVTMNHDQMLDKLPPGCKLIASTSGTPIAGFHHEEKHWWGLQFHPEKDYLGNIIFKNFYGICKQ